METDYYWELVWREKEDTHGSSRRTSRLNGFPRFHSPQKRIDDECSRLVVRLRYGLTLLGDRNAWPKNCNCQGHNARIHTERAFVHMKYQPWTQRVVNLPRRCCQATPGVSLGIAVYQSCGVRSTVSSTPMVLPTAAMGLGKEQSAKKTKWGGDGKAMM